MEKSRRKGEKVRSKQTGLSLGGIKGISSTVFSILFVGNVQAFELSDEVYSFIDYNSTCISIVCNRQSTYLDINSGDMDFSKLIVDKKCNPTHLDYITKDEYGRDILKEIHASELGRNALRLINCRTGLFSQKWVDIIGKLKPEIKITF